MLQHGAYFRVPEPGRHRRGPRDDELPHERLWEGGLVDFRYIIGAGEMLTFGPIPEMEHSDGPIVLGKNGGIAVYRFGSVLAWGKATPVVSNVQMLLMTKNDMGMGQSLHRRVRDLPPFYGFLS